MSRPESVFSQAETVNDGPSTRPPQEFVYYVKTTPKPPKEKKPKSKLGSFFDKFQSSAVKAAREIKEREEEEARRTGLKKYRPLPVTGSVNTFLV